MQRLLSTKEQPTGKLLSVASIWRKLLTTDFNAYLSPEPDWMDQSSTFHRREHNLRASMLRIFRKFNRRFLVAAPTIALIGYSHGGGTIYSLANQIVNDGIIPQANPGQPNHIIFAGTIDAVVRTDTDNSLFSASRD